MHTNECRCYKIYFKNINMSTYAYNAIHISQIQNLIIFNHVCMPPYSSFIGIGDFIITNKKFSMKINKIVANEDNSIISNSKKLIQIDNSIIRVPNSLRRLCPMTTSLFEYLSRENSRASAYQELHYYQSARINTRVIRI